MTPPECNAKGKELALRMLDTFTPDEFDPPIVIHCLAFLLAGLIRSADGEMTIHEQMGMGLLDDNTRLDLFREEVLEIVRQMREQPRRGPAPRTM